MLVLLVIIKIPYTDNVGRFACADIGRLAEGMGLV